MNIGAVRLYNSGMGEKVLPGLYLLSPGEAGKALIESRFKFPPECIYYGGDKKVYFDFTEHDIELDQYFQQLANKLNIPLEGKSS